MDNGLEHAVGAQAAIELCALDVPQALRVFMRARRGLVRRCPKLSGHGPNE